MATSKSRESEIRDYVQRSIRFGPEHIRWLNEETKRTGMSINAVVRRLIDDVRDYFGLPPSQLEVLEKDRAARNLDYRSYFQELASDRYRLLLRQQFEEEGGRKPKK